MIALGRSVPDIVQKLGIGDNLIYRWKRQAAGKNLGESGTSRYPMSLSKAQAEIERLSAAEKESESARLRAEQDREILKKVFGILGRGM